MIRLLIPVMALAAFFVYRRWGLAGTGALLAGYLVLGAISAWRLRTTERAMQARLEGLSDAELREALPQLAPAERAEVERVLRRMGRSVDVPSGEGRSTEVRSVEGSPEDPPHART